MTFIDIHPDVVFGAGRATAATSDEWSAWAGRAESLLRDVAGGTGDDALDAAFGDYVASWNPTLHSAAPRAFALGNNACGGAGLVSEGDDDGAHTIGAFGASVEQTTRALSRPINS